METEQEIQNEKASMESHRSNSGWHLSDKYGDVFISPDGSAWAVQQSGQRLINVKVNLNPSDVIKTPLLERRKQAIAKQSYRKGQGRRTSAVNLPLSEVETMGKTSPTGQKTRI
ncbi:MAG: hypothetical protein WAU55_10800 [Dehalococcoidales bacterium]